MSALQFIEIDRSARLEMAQAMRKFARGGMTVDEFEDVADLLSDRDHTVAEAGHFVWYFYDDISTERLTGKWRLSPKARRDWAKWVLFLLTSREKYTGPSMLPSLWPHALRFILALGLGLFGRTHPLLGFLAIGVYFAGLRLGLFRWVLRHVSTDRQLTDYWPFESAEALAESSRLANTFDRAIASLNA